jgi:hypothetical protein
MGRSHALVDLPKDRGPMMDHSVAPTEQRAARARNVTGKGQLRPGQETDRAEEKDTEGPKNGTWFLAPQ